MQSFFRSLSATASEDNVVSVNTEEARDIIQGGEGEKAAIEKTYAESLHKLSSVYGSKKVASKVGLEVRDGEHSSQSSGGRSEESLY